MTFVQKGQIFSLYDSSSSYKQIADITGYSSTRLQWMIEGIKGTTTWFDAIKVYEESEHDAKSTKPQKNYSKKSNSTRRSTSTSNSIRSNYKNISKLNSWGRGSKTRLGNVTNKNSNISRRDSIIDGLRKTKDYVGE